jgi:hypothetical protein
MGVGTWLHVSDPVHALANIDCEAWSIVKPVLDPRTIERLAEMVCDHGGPHERSTRALTRFLAGAGWDVEHPGGARVPWIVSEIEERNEDRAAIESLLVRIIDPREYDGGIGEAESLVKPLNELLAADGIEVAHNGSRATVRTIDDGDTTLDQLAAQLAGPEIRRALRAIVRDPAMAEILIARLDEVELCRKAGAYLLAVIGTGSFVEGLLYDILRQRDAETRQRDRPTLDFLLNRARKVGWIEHDAYTFSGIVREYRNLVHPRSQLDMKFHPDGDTVLLCWQPVMAVINDLGRLPGISQQR